MDNNKEYHDPDYPEPVSHVKEEPPSVSEEEKVEKIKSIIRREISNELEARENEVMLIDQRMSTSRRLLHRLRYAIVSRYYADQKLHMSNGQIQDEIAAQRDPRARNEVASLLSGQRQLHPSVRKLLGKRSVDIDEIFRTRAPRNKARKDYVAMLQKRNYTISADATATLRPGAGAGAAPGSGAGAGAGAVPKKVPRHVEPRLTNVVTLVEPTRNRVKNRYRIIIGNTSKYVPAASRLDRSTHKWLLYIRGPPAETATHGEPPDRADLARVVTAVTVTLHHSYAPHHIVHLDKPPYHISRRGWGEFPAKIELHFPHPERNRPASVTHTIKLDRNYTGMQMLGSETVVDVWLYSTPEMLPYEYIEEDTTTQTNTQTDEQTHALLPEIKTENTTEQSDDNWMDFFTKAPTELDVDEMIIKPTKNQTEPIKTEVEKEVQVKKEIPEEVQVKEEITEEIQVRTEFAEEVQVKTEKREPERHSITENILEVPNEIFNQPTSIKKRIVKYIDPTTGKIYYLEMDRELDLTKVQEIVINNKTAKISPIKSNGLKNVIKKKAGGMSLLKPEVKNLLKNENNKVSAHKLKPNLAHIENDHCYIAAPRLARVETADVDVKKEETLLENLRSGVKRCSDVRSAVNYLVKHIPLVSENARDPDFARDFPFVVEDSQRYWKLDFAKRRNIEWSRAKLINRILSEQFQQTEPVWRTKQILLYVRMHGHYPVRSETAPVQAESSEWSSWHDVESLRRLQGDLREALPRAADVSTLSLFVCTPDRLPDESCEISDDEEIDIVSAATRPKVRRTRTVTSQDEPLPVASDEDRARFLYLEKKCQDIGIELKNENIGSGYSYSAVHAVLLSAVKSFAEEMVRSALAEKRRREHGDSAVWTGAASSRAPVTLRDVFAAARGSARLRLVTSRDLGARAHRTYAI